MDASTSSLHQNPSPESSTRPRLRLASPALDLAAIAREIDTRYAASLVALTEGATQARDQWVKIGQLLLQVRAALPHGKFLPWLAANVKFSGSKARGCMRLARADPAKLATVVNLTVRGALTALAREGAKERPDLTSLAFALRLAQPCTRYDGAEILVHFCFDGDRLFAYDAIAAIIVDFPTGLHCAVRGEPLLKLVELAGRRARRA